MKPWWRVLVVLAFVLPVGGYVVGSLAASSVEDPAPRAPMQLRPAGAGDSPATPPDHTDDGTDEPIAVEPRLGDLDEDPGDDAGDDDD